MVMIVLRLHFRLPSTGGPASRQVEHGPGAEGARAGAKPDDQLGRLRYVAQAAHTAFADHRRDTLRGYLIEQGGFLPQPALSHSPKRRSVPIPCRPRQGNDAGVGCAIGGKMGRSFLARQSGNVDNATLGGVSHCRNDCAADVIDTEQIDVHDALLFAGVVFLDRQGPAE
jgi:hypothetical protein